MMDDKLAINPTTVLEQAALIWLDLWQLAGEKWPPENVSLAWRLYERLKHKLVGRGASEYHAIALCDDFFRSAARWGNLAVTTYHRRPIDDLTVALIDVDMIRAGAVLDKGDGNSK